MIVDILQTIAIIYIGVALFKWQNNVNKAVLEMLDVLCEYLGLEK